MDIEKQNSKREAKREAVVNKDYSQQRKGSFSFVREMQVKQRDLRKVRRRRRCLRTCWDECRQDLPCCSQSPFNLQQPDCTLLVASTTARRLIGLLVALVYN